MKIININGPINSGKTSVCKEIIKRLPHVLFIEVDELLSDEEQKAMNLDFMGGIKLRLDRLDTCLMDELASQRYPIVIFAYPMTFQNYERWTNIIDRRAEFKSVTLAPPLTICLTDRGNRVLSNWEIGRIKDMYAEGYHSPQETDLILDNSKETPQETAQRIINYFKLT